jgi:hypothetical protein
MSQLDLCLSALLVCLHHALCIFFIDNIYSAALINAIVWQHAHPPGAEQLKEKLAQLRLSMFCIMQCAIPMLLTLHHASGSLFASHPVLCCTVMCPRCRAAEGEAGAAGAQVWRHAAAARGAAVCTQGPQVRRCGSLLNAAKLYVSGNQAARAGLNLVEGLGGTVMRGLLVSRNAVSAYLLHLYAFPVVVAVTLAAFACAC